VSAQGDKRRADILRFVYEHVLREGYGATQGAIKRGVGYRGGNIREKHLDKMSSIYQGEDSRWYPAEEWTPGYIILIDPAQTERKVLLDTTFASVWHRGVASLAGQAALMADEGKDTTDVDGMLKRAREVEAWLGEGTP